MRQPPFPTPPFQELFHQFPCLGASEFVFSGFSHGKASAREVLSVVTDFVSSPASDALAMSVLKIKNGKFITIRKFKREMMLCAVEIQEEQENGTTWAGNSCVKQTLPALIYTPPEQTCCLLSLSCSTAGLYFDKRNKPCL